MAPSRWRYTWEAQAHSPNLKLFLFDSRTKPSLHCVDLRVRLRLSESRLLVTWTPLSQNGAGEAASLKVPIPNVLIDPEAPVHCRLLDDYIEVKLLLLLPVDHPLLSTFDSAFAAGGNRSGSVSDTMPRSTEYDLKNLMSSSEGVHLYCGSCGGTLTRAPIRHFVEMPSVNWRELADNWFGGCCCSFGGAGEKLVDRYVSSYTCAKGVCYLSASAVTLCKDDLVVSRQFAGLDCYNKDVSRPAVVDVYGIDRKEEVGVGAGNCRESPMRCDSESLKMNELQEGTRLLVGMEGTKSENEKYENPSGHMALRNRCCGSTCHPCDGSEEGVVHRVLEPSLLEAKTTQATELNLDQKSFLNGFLGDGFIARSQNLSVEIEWKQFDCVHCTAFLGVCPCTSEEALVDNGVRLFKCYVATSLPVGGSGDHFREYALERMFSDQLVENEKDELSFRTVVCDVETRIPVLRVVLINSSSWQYTGYCLDSESSSEFPLKCNLLPIVKVLFSDCSSNGESHRRELEDWVTKHRPDEFFMSRYLIEKLMESLASAKDVLPCSCTAVQGFALSSLPRYGRSAARMIMKSIRF